MNEQQEGEANTSPRRMTFSGDFRKSYPGGTISAFRLK